MPRHISLSTALAILAALLFLVAWNRGIALLYGMFSLVLATLAVGYAAPWWNLRGVEARRRHAAKVRAGDALELDLEFTRGGRLARYMLAVQDAVPCAVPEDQAPVAFVERVGGGAPTRVTMRVRCDWRGEHTLGPVTLTTGFPLGFRTAQRELPGSLTRVLVYPQTFRIGHFPYLTGAFLSPAETSPAAMAGNSTEFLNVREYVRGDNPRHIHWPLSAHRGTLVVREFEKISHADLCLLLNLDRRAVHGRERDSSFEWAVRIAASVAQHALDHGHRVRVLGYGRVPLLVPPGRGQEQMRRISEALAWVQPGDSVAYGTAVQRAQRDLGEGGVLVTFENSDESWRSLERDMSFSRAVRPVRVLLETRGFDRQQASGLVADQQPSGDNPHYRVRYGNDLEAVFGVRR